MPDPTVVGIDISKTHLDTYMAPAGKAARFTNDSAGFKGAHSRFPGHALTPTGVMAIRCKQFHLPDL